MPGLAAINSLWKFAVLYMVDTYPDGSKLQTFQAPLQNRFSQYMGFYGNVPIMLHHCHCQNIHPIKSNIHKKSCEISKWLNAWLSDCGNSIKYIRAKLIFFHILTTDILQFTSEGCLLWDKIWSMIFFCHCCALLQYHAILGCNSQTIFPS